MVSVNQRIWNIISKELCVERELLHGLINIRALAKYLIDKYSLNASLDSVISAIRRYEAINTMSPYRTDYRSGTF